MGSWLVNEIEGDQFGKENMVGENKVFPVSH